MTSKGMAAVLFTGILLWISSVIFYRLVLSPLSHIPGPWTLAVTKWTLAIVDWRQSRSQFLRDLHVKYGAVVRIGPSELSFNSVTALRAIYGTGSSFERPSFYDMFDLDNRKHLFTFKGSRDHAERRRLLAQTYTKSSILKGPTAFGIESRVKEYLQQLQDASTDCHQIFGSLNCYALDNITHLVYGQAHGTSSLTAATTITSSWTICWNLAVESVRGFSFISQVLQSILRPQWGLQGLHPTLSKIMQRRFGKFSANHVRPKLQP